MKEQTPSPPTLSSISPTLLTTFGSISGGGQRVFRTVFLALWRWLWPISRLDPMILAYLLPAALDQVEPNITLHQWFILSKLYFLSSGGAVAVNSHTYRFTSRERHVIPRLMDHGLIIRTTFNPADPYAIKPRSIQKTYISFTAVGVRYYKLVVKEVHRISHKDIYLLSLGMKEQGPNS